MWGEITAAVLPYAWAFLLVLCLVLLWKISTTEWWPLKGQDAVPIASAGQSLGIQEGNWWRVVAAIGIAFAGKSASNYLDGFVSTLGHVTATANGVSVSFNPATPHAIIVGVAWANLLTALGPAILAAIFAPKNWWIYVLTFASFYSGLADSALWLCAGWMVTGAPSPFRRNVPIPSTGMGGSDIEASADEVAPSKGSPTATESKAPARQTATIPNGKQLADAAKGRALTSAADDQVTPKQRDIASAVRYAEQRISAGSLSVSDQIAPQLYKGFVEKEDPLKPPTEVAITQSAVQPFLAKARLYTEAILLACLNSKSQDDPRYESVQRSFERFVFPANPDAAGIAKLEAIKGAMRSVAELLDSTKKSTTASVRWADSWLRSIGVNEDNPATLVLFAIWWMDKYVAITRAVDDMHRLLG